jgi:hypothetical protein
MKQELLNFVIDHLKHFKCYPIEFEYNNKVYDYNFIIETIQKRKETLNEKKQERYIANIFK